MLLVPVQQERSVERHNNMILSQTETEAQCSQKMCFFRAISLFLLNKKNFSKGGYVKV